MAGASPKFCRWLLPISAVAYTELIADGIYGEPTEKMLGVLKRLESNGKHLLGLINDVLDLSKIEAGQLKLDFGDYSIQDVAQTVYNTVEPLAADKRLSFKCEVAPNLPASHGDSRRLTQVLLNLVGNAIKFTDSGEVTIKVADSVEESTPAVAQRVQVRAGAVTELRQCKRAHRCPRIRFVSQDIGANSKTRFRRDRDGACNAAAPPPSSPRGRAPDRLT
jgi:signal transduction histidine kinase